MTYFGPKGAAIIGVPVLVRRGSWNDQRSSSGGFFSGLAGSLGRLAGGGSGGISSWGAAFTSTGTGALAASSLATNWYITIMANTSTSRPAIPMAKVSDR